MINWIRNLMASESQGRSDPTDDFWYTNIGVPSTAGIQVTHDNVLQLPVVTACLDVVSDSLAQLPFGMFSRGRDGDKQQVPEHPIHELIHDQPNDEHTAIEFREMMNIWAMLRGMAIAEKVPGARGAVDQLVPLHPDTITPKEVTDNGGRKQTQWILKERATPERRLLRDELFIIRVKAIGLNRLTGLDTVMSHRNTFGAALAVHEYGARFFKNDATPRTIFRHPKKFADDDSKKNWLKAITRAMTGPNRQKPMVLESDIAVETVGMTNEEAQFLETQKQRDLDITRIWNVQPHKAGILDRASFSNIEEQSIEFVVDTLMPWLVRWEQAVKRDLIGNPRFFAEHNVAGLLRGDIESRYKAYAIGRNWGWLSANDVLRLENMNSIGEEGDTYLMPTNMVPADDPPEPSGQNREPPGSGAFHMNGRGLWEPNSNTAA